MDRWTTVTDTPPHLRPCVATFGNFDGVHRGHQGVIARLRAEADARGLPAVAVTFDPHPIEIFHPERAAELISPGSLHEDLLAQTGIDGVLVIDFTPEYASQSARDFIVSTFVEGLAAVALVAVTLSATAVTPDAGTPPSPATCTSAAVPAPRGSRRGARRES